MSDPSKAVFLSYASQDAEAVLRIAEVLRAAGVEVWFDKNELVGGDAWDAKIRGQIASCALFVPVISAATQARGEGYFRLEWKLAVDRSHLMAHDQPFLLPIVVDATADAAARVPPEFRAVQWTRLSLQPAQGLPPGNEPMAAFCAQVQKLLGGSVAGVATLEPGRRADSGLKSVAPSGRAAVAPPASRWRVGAVVAALAVGIAVAWWFKGGTAPRADKSTVASVVAPKTEAAKLIERIKAIHANWLAASHEELVLAEELGAQVVALEPTNADAWAAYAVAGFLFVSVEDDNEHVAPTLSRAQRAMSLADGAFEPRLALALIYLWRQATFQEGLTLLRQLEKERPDDWRVLQYLAHSRIKAKAEDKLALVDRILALPGREAVAEYLRSIILMQTGRLDEAEAAIDRSLAFRVAPRTLMTKGFIQAFLRDDLAATAAIIEQIPGSFLIREAETYDYGEFWLLYRQTEKALKTFRAFDGDFLRDNSKGYVIGKGLELAGRAEAARYEWQLALKLVEGKIVAQPKDKGFLVQKAQLLACLGEKKKAEEILALIRNLDLRDDQKLLVPQVLVRLGRKDEAITGLVELWAKLDWDIALFMRMYVQHDPYYDPLRGDPRFLALIEKMRNDPRFPLKAKPAGASDLSGNSVVQAPAKSVAVLAFANLSDDKANEYFSDGISEELLNVLAKVPGLKVSARTSAFHFKGKDTPIPEIAKQLGVAYVVEGSVRKQGNQVRITAQLIKAADGFHVWSDNFTRDLKDIFAVQDEIAGLIAQNLQLKLGMKSAPRVVNPEAYALFLQGRAIINRGVPDDHAKGIQCFKDSLALDGGSALTWAWLATSYGTAAAQNTMPAAPTYTLAREAVNRALALDPELVEGHYALGSLQFLADWDWARANESLQHALLLAPGDANTLGQASNLAAALGQWERAVQLGRQAVALDPLNYFPAFVLGKAYFRTGRYAEMEKLAEQMIAVNPAGRFGPVFLAFAHLLQGRVATAGQTAEQMEPGVFQLMCLALARHAQGRGAESAAALNELKARNSEGRGYLIAEVYAYRGERDRAFEWLEQCYREHDSGLTWLVGDPFMQSLHGDARWAALLKKMNLPNSPAQ